MLTENFEEKILYEPALVNGMGCNHLRIITAFTDIERISSHLIGLADKEGTYVSNIKVDIILGMTKGTGLTKRKHEKICSEIKRINSMSKMPKVTCRYIIAGKQVHSKVYIWYSGRQAMIAYSGSANYTMNAFYYRRECMDVCDEKEAARYYRSLLKDTIDCFDEMVDERMVFSSHKNIEEDISDTNLENLTWEKYENKRPIDTLELSLLKADGTQTGHGSGVNWGIRRNGYKRNRNQAYIPYNIGEHKDGFFPTMNKDGTYPIFKVVIKNFGAFYMRQAQQNGKALETPESNAIIGEWIRYSLGIPDGTYITKEMLEMTAGTKVLFKKFEDGIYTLEY